jgi:hypothetical protein
MASKTQGTIVRVSTASAATKAITNVTKANPAVVTSTSHGYSDGDIITIDGVVGMTELNGRAFVVSGASGSPLSPNSFKLTGVNSTNYTTYTSGGTSSKQTMSAVGSVTGFDGPDGQSDEIDVTHLASSAKEYLVGLSDPGNVTLSVLLDNSNTGQSKLRGLLKAQTAAAFSFALTDGDTLAAKAFVRSFTMSAQPNGAYTSQVVLRLASEESGLPVS